MSHNALPTMQGYLYQILWALSELGSGRAARAGVEVADDVTLVDHQGVVEHHETKLTTTGANRPTDRSEALWKTLSNWLEDIDAGASDVEADRYVLITTSDVAATSLARRLSDADKPEEVKAAIGELRRQAESLLDRAGVCRFARRVLDARPQVLVALVRGFRCVDGSGGTRIDELRDALPAALGIRHRDEDQQRRIIDGLLGWIQQRLLERKTATEWIDGAELDRRREALSYDEDRVAFRAEHLVDAPESEVLAKLDAQFAQQLKLVEATEDEVIEAATDWIRATAERLRLSRAGHLGLDDLIAFDGRLERRHRDESRLLEWASAEPTAELIVGRKLLHQCMAHRESLLNVDAEPYFCKGSFHRLADDLAVGWHPRYKGLLGDDS